MSKAAKDKLPGAMLGEKAILHRMLVKGDLVIHPIIDLARQIGPASLDIRLSTRFQTQRTTSLIEVNPLGSDEQIEHEMLKVIDEYTIDPTEAFVLHPGDFALACTFEYVKIPSGLAARLEGRSSWARKGLQVHATAGFIDPGFEGYITFELSNVSKMPIALYPTLRIGQLSFYYIDEESSLLYGQKKLNKYQGDLGPGWTKIHKDPEWSIIRKQQEAEEIGPRKDWTRPGAPLWRHLEEL
jgi:dCTP deaminase